jgi:hypothetical protein
LTIIAAATVIATRLLNMLAVAPCLVGIGWKAVTMRETHMHCSPSCATDSQQRRNQDAKKSLHEI